MKAILKRNYLFIGAFFALVTMSSCGGHHVCATYVKKTTPIKKVQNADEFALNK